MSESRVRVLVEAIDKASNILKNVGKSVDGLSREFERLSGSVQTSSNVQRDAAKSSEQLSQKVSVLGDAAKIAGGILLRDLVRGLTSAVQESFKLSGQIGTLTTSFERLVFASGATNVSLESLRAATKGTVSDVDLLRSANQALLLGIPTEGLNELYEAAVTLGHAMGIDAMQAVESLTVGLGRQSKLVLDNLGVVFQAKDAYEWYADQLGKTSSELSESEKRLGWQKYAIMKITEKAEVLGDVTSSTQKSQEQWNATMRNLQTSIGGFMGPLSSIAPALNMMMPLFGTLAGTLLPQLITRTNLAAFAHKALAFAKALVSKETYVAIAAHAKHVAALVADKVATLAHKVATWLLNAALATKIALLTMGVGVIVAVTAATIALARMTSEAAGAETDLGVSAGYANKKLVALSNAVEEVGHWMWITEEFVKEKAASMREQYRLLQIEACEDLEAIGESYNEAFKAERWEDAARIIADFAREHNISFEEAEKIIVKYAEMAEEKIRAVEKLAEDLANQWSLTAAETSEGLTDVAVAFKNAYDEKRFKDAAEILAEFAEEHNVTLGEAEKMVSAYVEELEATALAFRRAFDAGKFREAERIIVAFARQHKLSFEEAEKIVWKFLEGTTAALSEYEEALQVVEEAYLKWTEAQADAADAQEEFTATLEHDWRLLRAASSDFLEGNAELFREYFAAENFEGAAAVVQGFAAMYTLSLDEARRVLEEYVAEEDTLLSRSQDNMEKFKNCVSGKAATLNDDFVGAMHQLASDTNDLIKSGLLGQAQDNIKAYTECSGNKIYDMVEDIRVSMDRLTDEHNAQIARMRAFAETLTGEEKDAVLSQIDMMVAEYNAKMEQLEHWQSLLLGKMADNVQDFSEAVVTGSIWPDMLKAMVKQTETAMENIEKTMEPTVNVNGVREQAFTPVRPRNLQFNGPLVVVQGDASESTAKLAAKLILRDLRKYVVS